MTDRGEMYDPGYLGGKEGEREIPGMGLTQDQANRLLRLTKNLNFEKPGTDFRAGFSQYAMN